MKAVVLSAGQGRRLLPLTAEEPKCLLTIDGDQPLLEVQLRAIARCGVRRATVVTGFGAERVEQFLARTPIRGLSSETVFNPFYAISDNLATCWLARGAMDDDFVLVNGDTVFEDRVLTRVLERPPAPIVVTIDHKDSYDEDDMKVSLDDEGRLLAIGKTLKPEAVHGESIGLLCFRGPGPLRFRTALERRIRETEALRAWYLSVVDDLARDGTVETASIHGMWWREVDSPEDLEEVRREAPAHSGARAVL
jgi:choline kinase